MNRIIKMFDDKKIIKRKKYFHRVQELNQKSFKYGQEIRLSIAREDLNLLPCESCIIIQGTIKDENDNVLPSFKFRDNILVLMLFDEVRYNLNEIEIDRSKDLKNTSALKNLLFLNEDFKKKTSEEDLPLIITLFYNGCFKIEIPLKTLLGFAANYKKMISNAKHELILILSKTYEEMLNMKCGGCKVVISKLIWKVPHVELTKIGFAQVKNIAQIKCPIYINFPRWNLYEYSNVQNKNHFKWSLETDIELKKTSFIIIALNQMKNQYENNYNFDICKLNNFKVHVNSKEFTFNSHDIKDLLTSYNSLRKKYFKQKESSRGQYHQTFLNLKDLMPVAIIDVSWRIGVHNNELINLKMEFENDIITENTKAYCLFLHDQNFQYNLANGEIKEVM